MLVLMTNDYDMHGLYDYLHIRDFITVSLHIYESVGHNPLPRSSKVKFVIFLIHPILIRQIPTGNLIKHLHWNKCCISSPESRPK